MTGWIFIFILLLIAFLLLCPVTVSAEFKNELSIRIKYLFIRHKIFPQPEKPKKEENEKKKEKIEKTEKKSKIKGIIEQKGLSGFLNIIKEFSLIATHTAKNLLSHILIKRIYIKIVVADEDAAQAAISYGQTCSIVYTAFGWILSNAKYNRYYINIVPDFDSKESRIYFELKVKIKLIFIILIFLSALFKSLKVLKTSEINLSKN
jgi:hypothetical protein